MTPASTPLDGGPGWQREAARQRALVTSLFQQPSTATPASAPHGVRGGETGLAAYRLNARATARHVLRSAYPTVAAMLGPETLDAIAPALWCRDPPESGDLGLWGGDLAGYLDAHPDLRDWPYLGDCARVDWARHMCERAQDATLALDTLHLLGESNDPATLIIRLQPGLSVVASPWPVVSLYVAHRQADEADGRAPGQIDQPGQADHAELALQDGAAETAVIWRQGWQATVAVLPPPMAAWMLALSGGGHDRPAVKGEPFETPRLSTLLMSHQGEGDFDFTEWLALAIRSGWLWRIETAA